MSPKGPHGRLQFVLAMWFENLARPHGSVLGPLTGLDRIDLGDVLPAFELTIDELCRARRARPD